MYKPTDFEKRAAKEREMIFEDFLREGLSITILRRLKSLAVDTVKNCEKHPQCINLRETFESILGAGFLLCSTTGRTVSSKISGNGCAVCDFKALECLLFTLIDSVKESKELKINVKLEKQKATLTLNKEATVNNGILSAASATLYTKKSGMTAKTMVVIRFAPEYGETISTESEIDYLSDPLSYAYIYLCEVCRNPLSPVTIKV